MKGLRKLFNRFEGLMSAAAFAEEGEFDTAREIMRETESKNERMTKRVDRSYTQRVTVQKAK